MTIKRALMKRESDTLKPYATFSAQAVRRHSEQEWEYSTPFQADRDKILGCGSFAVLRKKTQIFFDPCKDGYRTRMTHTLQVAKIARTIARCLGLNEDLAEAIALAHDLGHPPLAHQAEALLNKLNPNGFSHYRQGVRIVENIEELNLTLQVIDGIEKHNINSCPVTPEGHVTLWSDKMAYVCHDLHDALTANCIKEKDIPKCFLEIGGLGGRVPKKKELVTQYFDERERKMIEMFVNGAKITENRIIIPPDLKEIITYIRSDFMPQRVHASRDVLEPEKNAAIAIEHIFKNYLKNPGQLPTLSNIGGTLEDRICDYIVSCSDSKIKKKLREINPELGNKLFGAAEGTPVSPKPGLERRL